MGRFRFSLRLFMLLVTATVIFLGYGQWRRSTVLKQCERFYLAGVDIRAPAAWLDYIWQRVPESATLYEDRFISMDVRADQRALERERLRDRVRELKSFGITQVRVRPLTPDDALADWASRSSEDRERRRLP